MGSMIKNGTLKTLYMNKIDSKNNKYQSDDRVGGL